MASRAGRRMAWRGSSTFGLAVAVVLMTASIAWATASTGRVSVSSTGRESNGSSADPDVSATGRYVAFDSNAKDLVHGDTNNVFDCFVRDRHTHTTIRVSVSSTGTQGNNDSNEPAISGDGRFVAFDSAATNLVNGDKNHSLDVFVRDTQTNTTTRVSIPSAGGQANGDSYDPAISSDGRFVVFDSIATNLVAGGTTGEQVFVRDRQAHTTSLVSVSSTGVLGDGSSFFPVISDDGQIVAFESDATTLVGSDDNFHTDVFLRDRTAHTTIRVSVSSAGAQGDADSGDPSISADGRYVAFASAATTLVNEDANGHEDIFVRDTQAPTTTLISVSSGGVQGNGDSDQAAISGDGRFVAFRSSATNLVNSDTNFDQDVFVRGPLI